MTTAVMKAEVQARINALTYPIDAAILQQNAVDTVGLDLDLTNIIAVLTTATSAITNSTPADDITALNIASVALGVTSKGASGGGTLDTAIPKETGFSHALYDDAYFDTNKLKLVNPKPANVITQPIRTFDVITYAATLGAVTRPERLSDGNYLIIGAGSDTIIRGVISNPATGESWSGGGIAISANAAQGLDIIPTAVADRFIVACYNPTNTNTYYYGCEYDPATRTLAFSSSATTYQATYDSRNVNVYYPLKAGRALALHAVSNSQVIAYTIRYNGGMSSPVFETLVDHTDASYHYMLANLDESFDKSRGAGRIMKVSDTKLLYPVTSAANAFRYMEIDAVTNAKTGNGTVTISGGQATYTSKCLFDDVTGRIVTFYSTQIRIYDWDDVSNTMTLVSQLVAPMGVGKSDRVYLTGGKLHIDRGNAYYSYDLDLSGSGAVGELITHDYPVMGGVGVSSKRHRMMDNDNGNLTWMTMLLSWGEAVGGQQSYVYDIRPVGEEAQQSGYCGKVLAMTADNDTTANVLLSRDTLKTSASLTVGTLAGIEGETYLAVNESSLIPFRPPNTGRLPIFQIVYTDSAISGSVLYKTLDTSQNSLQGIQKITVQGSGEIQVQAKTSDVIGAFIAVASNGQVYDNGGSVRKFHQLNLKTNQNESISVDFYISCNSVSVGVYVNVIDGEFQVTDEVVKFDLSA